MQSQSLAMLQETDKFCKTLKSYSFYFQQPAKHMLYIRKLLKSHQRVQSYLKANQKSFPMLSAFLIRTMVWAQGGHTKS